VQANSLHSLTSRIHDLENQVRGLTLDRDAARRNRFGVLRDNSDLRQANSHLPAQLGVRRAAGENAHEINGRQRAENEMLRGQLGGGRRWSERDGGGFRGNQGATLTGRPAFGERAGVERNRDRYMREGMGVGELQGVLRRMDFGDSGDDEIEDAFWETDSDVKL
jgi:hypothetical protein